MTPTITGLVLEEEEEDVEGLTATITGLVLEEEEEAEGLTATITGLVELVEGLTPTITGLVELVEGLTPTITGLVLEEEEEGLTATITGLVLALAVLAVLAEGVTPTITELVLVLVAELAAELVLVNTNSPATMLKIPTSAPSIAAPDVGLEATRGCPLKLPFAIKSFANVPSNILPFAHLIIPFPCF